MVEGRDGIGAASSRTSESINCGHRKLESHSGKDQRHDDYTIVPFKDIDKDRRRKNDRAAA